MSRIRLAKRIAQVGLLQTGDKFRDKAIPVKFASIVSINFHALELRQ
jgi:hypothetical protein